MEQNPVLQGGGEWHHSSDQNIEALDQRLGLCHECQPAIGTNPRQRRLTLPPKPDPV